MNPPTPPTAPPVLPVLFSVRGWNEEINKSFIEFGDAMRATGVEVVDIYVPPAGFRTFGEWAFAIAEEIDRRRSDSEPLHLLSYCLGGNLLLVALVEFERRGISPAYVGMIDAVMYTPLYRLQRGLDARFQTPWPVRARGLMSRLTPPDRETFGSVAASVLSRSLRSVIELPKRGWRSNRRRIPMYQTEHSLSAAWDYDATSTPVIRYTAQAMIDRYSPDDPSLNMGIYHQGGFVVRMVEGDHETCIEPPQAAGLIEKITSDRVAVVQGVGVFQ